MRRKIGDTLVERSLAATRNKALGFAFWTMIEFAEPPQIAVAARFKQKQVELLADEADSDAGLVSF